MKRRRRRRRRKRKKKYVRCKSYYLQFLLIYYTYFLSTYYLGRFLILEVTQKSNETSGNGVTEHKKSIS